ncbi:MAG: hypothetical protein ACKVOU_14220 [Cytophagales bacterium]
MYTIKLSNTVGNHILSRASIESIFSKLDSSDVQITLDFNDVQFVSRAVAHEIVSGISTLSASGVNVDLLNINFEVNDLIRKVVASQKHNVKKATFVENVAFRDEKELKRFLKTI